MVASERQAHLPTEQELRDELSALVRELHGKKQAEEIVQSFESVLEQSASERERMGIVEHWRDFYRLRKYRQLMRRRRPTYQERMTPCTACGYPASHRHHLWDVQMHGENRVTIQLCPNCHELHHLIYNALVRDSAYSQRLALHILFSGTVRPETVRRVLEWCRATVQYESELGWVEPFRTADEWVDQRLRWSEFEAANAPDTSANSV
jgi:ribosomal protein L37E